MNRFINLFSWVIRQQKQLHRLKRELGDENETYPEMMQLLQNFKE